MRFFKTSYYNGVSLELPHSLQHFSNNLGVKSLLFCVGYLQNRFTLRFTVLFKRYTSPSFTKSNILVKTATLRTIM